MNKDILPDRVTIIGHVCIDHNVIEGERVDSWGSPAMYIAKYLRDVVGINTHIVAAHGKDFAEYAASVQLTESAGDFSTLVYQNLVENGHRVRKCFNAENSPPIEPSPHVQALLAGSDICIMASILGNYSADYTKRVFAHVPETSLKILAPQGHFRVVHEDGIISTQPLQEPKALLPLFDAVAISDEDIEDALNEARRWSELAPKTIVVVTQAERGATVFLNGAETQVPTVPIANEDLTSPVGCGDLFVANLSLNLHKGLGPIEAVDATNKAMHDILLKSTKN